MKADQDFTCYHCEHRIKKGDECVKRRYGTYHLRCWITMTRAAENALLTRAEGRT